MYGMSFQYRMLCDARLWSGTACTFEDSALSNAEMDRETGFYEDEDVPYTGRLAGKVRRDDSDSIMSPASNEASRRYALAKQLIELWIVMNLLSL